MNFRRRKITFNAQERIFSFHEVAMTVRKGRKMMRKRSEKKRF